MYLKKKLYDNEIYYSVQKYCSCQTLYTAVGFQCKIWATCKTEHYWLLVSRYKVSEHRMKYILIDIEK